MTPAASVRARSVSPAWTCSAPQQPPPAPGSATRAPVACITRSALAWTSRCHASITQPVNSHASASSAPVARGTSRSRRMAIRGGRPSLAASDVGTSRNRCATPRIDDPASSRRWSGSRSRARRSHRGAVFPWRASDDRVSSISRPNCTPEGHAVSHARHITQRSRNSTAAASTGRASSSMARISEMRPRGEAVSSPVARYVGQCGRQRPHDTQATSRSSSRRSGPPVLFVTTGNVQGRADR